MANRNQRRAAQAYERSGLKGHWGEWRKTNLPDGIPNAHGWCKDFSTAYANNLYSVLVRPFKDEYGRKVIHLAIRTASNREPPWRDLQRIKKELFGDDMTAVQVMPPEFELVDDADMYHIWVFSSLLPFTLADRRYENGSWVFLDGWVDPPTPPDGYTIEVKTEAYLGTVYAYRFVPIEEARAEDAKLACADAIEAAVRGG